MEEARPASSMPQICSSVIGIGSRRAASVPHAPPDKGVSGVSGRARPPEIGAWSQCTSVAGLALMSTWTTRWCAVAEATAHYGTTPLVTHPSRAHVGAGCNQKDNLPNLLRGIPEEDGGQTPPWHDRQSPCGGLACEKSVRHVMHDIFRCDIRLAGWPRRRRHGGQAHGLESGGTLHAPMRGHRRSRQRDGVAIRSLCRRGSLYPNAPRVSGVVSRSWAAREGDEARC